MNNSLTLGLELLISTSASSMIAISENLDALVTALITFVISLVTLVGGELIKFLVAYFKNKTSKYDKEDKKDDTKLDDK